MQFNDASRKFALSVLVALDGGPLSPAALMAATGASRSKVMRMLAYLVEDGLIFKASTGPRATYAKPTLQDLSALPRLEKGEGYPQLTVSLSEEDSQLLFTALEFISRMGMGQWEALAEQFTWDAFFQECPRHHDGPNDHLEAALKRLKVTALGFGAGHSWGIFGKGAHPTALPLWGMARAIRHRLAWDRTPAGGMGVTYDEPLREEARDSVVFSVTVATGTRVCITAEEPIWGAVAAALNQYVALARGEFGVLVSTGTFGLYPTPREHFSPNSEEVQEAVRIAKATVGITGFLSALKLSSSSMRLESIEQALRSRLLKAGPAGLESVSLPAVEPVTPSFPTLSTYRGLAEQTIVFVAPNDPQEQELGKLKLVLEAVPSGYSIYKAGSQFKIMRSSPDEPCSVVLGQAGNLQTAVCQLANAANGVPLRSFDF